MQTGEAFSWSLAPNAEIVFTNWGWNAGQALNPPVANVFDIHLMPYGTGWDTYSGATFVRPPWAVYDAEHESWTYHFHVQLIGGGGNGGGITVTYISAP